MASEPKRRRSESVKPTGTVDLITMIAPGLPASTCATTDCTEEVSNWLVSGS